MTTTASIMADLFEADFDLETLATLRHAVTERAKATGMDPEQLDGYILAVNEIISNAIVHGGGRGRLRLWLDGTTLCCRISDGGPGISDLTDPRLPPLSSPCGRGLWLASQFCDLEITSSGLGTTVEVSTRVTAD